MKPNEDAFDEYMAIVKQAGGHYQIQRLKPKRRVISFTMRGFKFLVQREEAFTLKGWYPWSRIRFFQTIIDAISHRFVQIGFLYYDETDSPNDQGYIEPKNRIRARVVKPEPTDVLTPSLHHTIADSNVWEDRMRKLSFGQTVSLKVLIVVLVAVLALMIVLNMGGYFG